MINKQARSVQNNNLATLLPCVNPILKLNNYFLLEHSTMTCDRLKDKGLFIVYAEGEDTRTCKMFMHPLTALRNVITPLQDLVKTSCPFAT